MALLRPTTWDHLFKKGRISARQTMVLRSRPLPRLEGRRLVVSQAATALVVLAVVASVRTLMLGVLATLQTAHSHKQHPSRRAVSLQRLRATARHLLDSLSPAPRFHRHRNSHHPVLHLHRPPQRTAPHLRGTLTQMEDRPLRQTTARHLRAILRPLQASRRHRRQLVGVQRLRRTARRLLISHRHLPTSARHLHSIVRRAQGTIPDARHLLPLPLLLRTARHHQTIVRLLRGLARQVRQGSIRRRRLPFHRRLREAGLVLPLRRNTPRRPQASLLREFWKSFYEFSEQD